MYEFRPNENAGLILSFGSNVSVSSNAFVYEPVQVQRGEVEGRSDKLLQCVKTGELLDNTGQWYERCTTFVAYCVDAPPKRATTTLDSTKNARFIMRHGDNEDE